MRKYTMKGGILAAMLLSGLMCGETAARSLSAEEALARATESGIRKMPSVKTGALRLAYTLKSGNDGNALYVFNGKTGGYLVTAADDIMPAVLGYSDSGCFDSDNVSPAMQWWLESYSRQLEYCQSQGVADAAVKENPNKPKGGAVEPIVKTLWDQGSPYNLDCPKENNTRTYTGCVATAMAQVIKAHEWPKEHGIGEYKYSWSYQGGAQRLRYDYASATFEWNQMLDRYHDADGNELGTDEQKAAVANLMYACGVGVQMDYGTNGSGAVSMRVPRALIQNFGYSPSMRYVERDYFSYGNWDQLVYDELAAGRPVLYAGVTGNREGHEFVCDGYDGNGYFHFNWGWSGESDGYFLLTALNPPVLGIGGGMGGGFNFYQDIIVGMQPPVAESGDVNPYVLATGIMTAEVDGGKMKINVASNGMVNYGFFFCQNWEDTRVVPGVRLYGNGKDLFFPSDDEYYFPSLTDRLEYGAYKNGYTAKVDYSALAPGQYVIYPSVREGESVYPIYSPAAVTKRQYLNVGEDGSLEITMVADPEPEKAKLEIVGFEQQGDINPGEEGVVKADLKVEGDGKFDVSFSMNVYSEESLQNLVATVPYSQTGLEGGSVYPLYLQVKLDLPEGKYYVVFKDEDYETISQTYTLTLGDMSGIESVNGIDTKVDVYSLEGVLLMKEVTPSSVDSLDKGIYILKGNGGIRKIRK